MPVLGTCAGLILLASEVLDGRPDQPVLGAIDLTVRRNAHGRQRDSFEAPLEITGLGGGPFPGVFIRAPGIERVGQGVDVLARLSSGTNRWRPGRARSQSAPSIPSWPAICASTSTSSSLSASVRGTEP